MTNPTMNSEDLLPAAGTNLGVELTPDDLKSAADNLTRMRAWTTDVYVLTSKYEDVVFDALGSTTNHENWTNFIVDIFIDIGVAIIGAAALITENPEVMPALALVAASLKDWGFGKDKPSNLNDFFADFKLGHLAMQNAIEDLLSHLVDPGNNYSNLSAAWENDIVFNGKTYKLADLATSNFPGLGDEYNKLKDAAENNFQKSLWNLAVMKCCTYYENYHFLEELSNMTAVEYAQDNFYNDPQYAGTYLRGYKFDSIGDYTFVYWNLGIGGYPFSTEASKILFIDDTPGHIINPDGLFNRSYVFEQFSTYKGEGFLKWHELADNRGEDFDPKNDDFTFTGGMFPYLTTH